MCHLRCFNTQKAVLTHPCPSLLSCDFVPCGWLTRSWVWMQQKWALYPKTSRWRYVHFYKRSCSPSIQPSPQFTGNCNFCFWKCKCWNSFCTFVRLCHYNWQWNSCQSTQDWQKPLRRSRQPLASPKLKINLTELNDSLLYHCWPSQLFVCPIIPSFCLPYFVEFLLLYLVWWIIVFLIWRIKQGLFIHRSSIGQVNFYFLLWWCSIHLMLEFNSSRCLFVIFGKKIIIIKNGLGQQISVIAFQLESDAYILNSSRHEWG